MQVYQRGLNESLIIGHDVIVTVLDIQPHCVRIAIQDPESIPPYREETLYLDQGDAETDALVLAGSTAAW